MKKRASVSRRQFMGQASAGVGLYAAAHPSYAPQTPTQEANPRAGRLPREVWIASLDLRDLYPGTSVQKRIDDIFDRMENVTPFQPDIVCLPETFTTSWVHTDKPLRELAEETPGPVTTRAGEFAKKNNCYVICAILTRKGDHVYNSAVLIDRSGREAGVYHKIHATEGEMDDGVSPGPKQPPVFQTDFGKIGIQICYDANWFDGWRSLKSQGAEIVFFPSQFPGGRILSTHAWMNQYYVVSSTGEDARIIDISGDDVASSGPFERWLCRPINLEKTLVHIWPEVNTFPEIRKKYGRRVSIKIWHPENWATIESLDADLRVADVLREFKLVPYEEHIRKAYEAQDRRRQS